MISIKEFFLSLLEGLQEARKHQAESYLSRSEDHHDLERREKELKKQGVL